LFESCGGWFILTARLSSVYQCFFGLGWMSSGVQAQHAKCYSQED